MESKYLVRDMTVVPLIKGRFRTINDKAMVFIIMKMGIFISVNGLKIFSMVRGTIFSYLENSIKGASLTEGSRVMGYILM